MIELRTVKIQTSTINCPLTLFLRSGHCKEPLVSHPGNCSKGIQFVVNIGAFALHVIHFMQDFFLDPAYTLLYGHLNTVVCSHIKLRKAKCLISDN